MSLADQLSQLKQTADNFVNKQLGIVPTVKASSVGIVPWNGVQSKFFNKINIDPARWDQLFPYRLVVIDATNKNSVVGGIFNNTLLSSISASAKVTTFSEKNNVIVNFEPLGRSWVFRLPITPQQLSISDQFAINTTATLRGILEEHNGVKFKIINCSGSMGVWPYRSSVVTPPQSPTVLQSIFGGTIESLTNVASQLTRVVNTATSNHPANKPPRKGPEESPFGNTSTGYYQALSLQQFLEQYAEAKKDPNNAGWRLVFDIPKQNQSFVVTPMQYVWQQNENKPTHINYNFQLKAWRRIDLSEKTSAIKPSVQPISPGILQRILNTISEARKLASAATNLIGAVRSDVSKPLDVLRQTSLFIKDLSGTVVTVADLPFQIQKDFASSIKESLNTLKDSILTVSTDPSVRAAISTLSASTVVLEGLSFKAVAGGQLGNSAVQLQSIDPTNNVFKNPEQNFSLMDQVPVYSLSLNVAQQTAVDQVIENARQITVDDLKSFRGTILELALQLSNNFGAGDAFYDQIYGRPPPLVRIAPMTVEEYEILKSLYDTMQSYDILTATTEVDDANKQTNMEYVAGLADQVDIEFNISTSKILAPVPFGLTIEGIAMRYLGDPQRWLEIVTLNNLRDPYIDENGFQRSFLSNATGRQVTISSVEEMYIGQRVLLRSSTQMQTARKILGIDRLSDTSFLITFDGEADLDNFLVADSAYIQAYLPGTVNSQQKIFIPSNIPVPEDDNIVIPPSTVGDPLVSLSKVDWLLTDSGDIAVNNYGDFRFSSGITNIIQALKIKIGTSKGSVLTHPEFGLGIRPGTISSDIDVQDVYNSISKLIEEDQRFQGLDSLQIVLNGPTLSINMGVILAGVQGVFPLTFEFST